MAMQLSDWQDKTRYWEETRKNGFQLKLGPSILFPKTFKVTKRSSDGWTVESSEKQNVGLKVNVGFVGRPHVAIDDVEASRLPVPIHITAYKPQQPVTVHFFSRFRKKQSIDPLQIEKGSKISQWYKTHKALKSGQKVQKRELKRQQPAYKDKSPQKREKEVLKQLYKREKELRRLENQIKLASAESRILENYNSQRKGGPIYMPTSRWKKNLYRRKKTKSVGLKPIYKKRHVVAQSNKKRYREPFRRKIRNACYRLCCKIYCYITLILIIAGVVFLVI